VKQKRPQIGDLVKLIRQPWQGAPNMLIGIVVEHIGIRCKVFYTSGCTGEPMREMLEVL
jgi:hypothetical protein